MLAESLQEERVGFFLFRVVVLIEETAEVLRGRETAAAVLLEDSTHSCRNAHGPGSCSASCCCNGSVG